MRNKKNSKQKQRQSSRRRVKISTPHDFEVLEQRQCLTSVSYLLAFTPDAGLYQVYSNYGKIGQVDLETQTFAVAEYSAGTKVNAAGFRSSDNYAYGVIVATGEIARIGSNGEMESLGQVENLPNNKGTYFVGDFANDDLLYMRNSGEKDTLYGVNVDTMQVDNVIKTTVNLNNIYDIAFNNVDEKFYASQRGPVNVLISIDLEGNVETIGENGLTKLTFGAMYADASGSIFGAANSTGNVYRFNTQTGAATLVGQGPSSGTNDGFSNAGQILEMAPNAIDDSFTMDSLSVTAGNLFAGANGSDIDGNDDRFVITEINGDAQLVGTTFQLDSGSSLSVGEKGQFVFKPSSEFTFLEIGETASDSFEYKITDTTGRSDEATVTITVNGTFEADEFGNNRVVGLDSFGGPNSALLSEVGDINGDGIVDGAVGLPTAYGGKGVTFVVFGTESGMPQDFNVNDLRSFNGNDGSQGSIVYGVAVDDLSGYSVASAGDVNDDGFDDLLIGAKDADANGVVNSGQAYVLFGASEGMGAEVRLSSLLTSNGGDGSKGFVVHGINTHDLAGEVVTGIGDINVDGVDDFAIGAQNADADADRVNSGQTYVVFGNKLGFDAEMNLGSLRASDGGDGSKGFIINGVRKHDLAGGFVTGGKDVNGDQVADMLISAFNADSKGLVDSGQSYVLFGSDDGFGSEVELADFLVENGNDGSRGFSINGNKRFRNHGFYVDMSTDTNGDGVADLLLGRGDKRSTCAGVMLGGSNVFGNEVNLSTFDKTPVYLDNFDKASEYDGRSWEALPFSATLYSGNGTQVTIWGDPHVVITTNGTTERFDIGYGAGTIELIGGATINWDTFEPGDPAHPLGPPLKWFSVDTSGSEFDVTVDTANDENSIGNLTSLNEAQLLDFAAKLRLLAGDASAPLIGQ